MNKFKLLAAISVAGFLLCSADVFAQISLNGDFEGTVMVTSEDGKIAVLDPGQPVPEIATNSLIEVFLGHISVSLEAGEQASVGCFGSKGTVSGPATVELTCGETEGTIKAVKGSIAFTDDQGNQSQIAEGSEKTFSAAGQAVAPATAAGEEEGSAVDLGQPPVDSRSIETSPAQ